MFSLPRCPVCDGTDFNQVFENEFFGGPAEAAPYFLTDRQKAVHGRIVRCGTCAFIFTSPQFTAAEYEEIYRQVASGAKPSARSRATMKRYEKLAAKVRNYVSGGSFFDFGCGGGEFLGCMKSYQGIGLELRSSAAAPEYSKENRIIFSSLDNALADGLLKASSFDFITTWDVIEHLPKLNSDIATLKGLLKPSGWLFCTVPNVASIAARISGEKWNCYLLEHLWYFSPRTLSAFFDKHGFVASGIRSFMFPADFETLALRVAQTYKVRLPLPAFVKNLTVSLPAGVMFGAFQLKS